MAILQQGESSNLASLTEQEPACAGGLSREARVRFWSRVRPVARGPRKGCWLWTGARHPFGHGRFALGTGIAPGYTHRIAWELLRGAIPAGMQVNHHCDEPSCVNPDHLYVGTQGDNMRDAKRRGRLATTHAHRKMTAEQVIECRMLRESGWALLPLAHRYSVSKPLISMLCRGLRRKALRITTVHVAEGISQVQFGGTEIPQGTVDAGVGLDQVGFSA